MGIGFSFATDLLYCTAFFTCDNTSMYLKTHKRKKNGKYHEYYSIAEKRKISRGRYVEKIVLYLGEISDSQKKSWQKSIEILNEDNKPIYKSLFVIDTAVITAPTANRSVSGLSSVHAECLWAMSYLSNIKPIRQFQSLGRINWFLKT